MRVDTTLARAPEETPAALAVSDEMGETHAGAILSKQRLAHRAQAVICALKIGLISLDEREEPRRAALPPGSRYACL